MKRESVNPWDWGLKLNMDQGQLVEGVQRYLHCSGQVSAVPDDTADWGIAVKHANDIRGQMELSLSNIDAVLNKAGMNRSNILSLRIFTTDVDGLLGNYDVYIDWIKGTGTRPPQTLLGVNRLALPDLMVEIEAIAGE